VVNGISGWKPELLLLAPFMPFRYTQLLPSDFLVEFLLEAGK
jgi:hypothetical protein